MCIRLWNSPQANAPTVPILSLFDRILQRTRSDFRLTTPRCVPYSRTHFQGQCLCTLTVYNLNPDLRLREGVRERGCGWCFGYAAMHDVSENGNSMSVTYTQPGLWPGLGLGSRFAFGFGLGLCPGFGLALR